MQDHMRWAGRGGGLSVLLSVDWNLPSRVSAKTKPALAAAHTDTLKTHSAPKKNRNPPCVRLRTTRRAKSVCVTFCPVCARASDPRELPTSLHLHSALTNRVKQVVASEWVERLNQKKKKLTVCAVVAVAVVVVVLCSRCCSVVSLSPSPGCVRSCVCVLPSCWFVSHSPFFCFSVCVLSIFVSCFFVFYLCVTVRPFLCGSVSCV